MFPGRFCAPRLLFSNGKIVIYHLNHSLVSGWASSRWSRSGSLNQEATPGFGSQVKLQKKHFPVLPISLAILRVSSILQSSSSSFHQGGCSGLRSGMGRSSSFSSLFSLVGEMARASRLDPFASLRPSGVEGAAGDAAGGGEAGGAPAWAAW